MWSQRHEMVGWLDGTWGRVMGEFGGISSRRCEVFASFVPPPPLFFVNCGIFCKCDKRISVVTLAVIGCIFACVPHTYCWLFWCWKVVVLVGERFFFGGGRGCWRLRTYMHCCIPSGATVHIGATIGYILGERWWGCMGRDRNRKIGKNLNKCWDFYNPNPNPNPNPNSNPILTLNP
jgi:hypothetical protein